MQLLRTEKQIVSRSSVCEEGFYDYSYRPSIITHWNRDSSSVSRSSMQIISFTHMIISKVRRAGTFHVTKWPTIVYTSHCQGMALMPRASAISQEYSQHHTLFLPSNVSRN
jgi:hypothetical protein